MAGKHAFRIDGDKHGPSSRQHFAALVADFRYVYVYPAAHAALVALGDERLAQRNWLQIFHFHRLSEGHHRAQFVHFAHGFVQNGGDDAAMGVSRRSLIAARQAKAAPGAALGFVKIKFKMHALRIGRPTSKAAIGYSSLDGVSARMNFLGHRNFAEELSILASRFRCHALLVKFRYTYWFAKSAGGTVNLSGRNLWILLISAMS